MIDGSGAARWASSAFGNNFLRFLFFNLQAYPVGYMIDTHEGIKTLSFSQKFLGSLSRREFFAAVFSELGCFTIAAR